MPEEVKNNPEIDPSGLFSTYKSHPTEEGDIGTSSLQTIPSVDTPHSSTTSEKENGKFQALHIIINGCIQMAKIGVWGIAVCGGLFLVSLSTNTFDRAVQILNANIGTHIIVSGEVKTQPEALPQETTQTGLTSSAINNSTPTNATPEALASKRRAILEAKKAAKLLEEKQKSLENVTP